MKRPLILDGAMGTELQNRGVKVPLPLWSANANIEHPEIVINIHKDYIESGSDIITANTFRSTSWTYRKVGYGKKKSVEMAKLSLYKAVECAQKAISDSTRIAGSITSIEDCYTPSAFPGRSIAEDTYGYSTEWLVDAGADIILFETMGNIQEISCGLEMVKNLEVPVWLSIILKDDSHLLDETPIQDVIELINRYHLDCLMTNCNQIDTTLSALDGILKLWAKEWGVYPNLGINDYGNDYFTIVDDSNFRSAIATLFSYEPDVIGLCCGSTPKHITELKNIHNMKNQI
jgi:S-methylmethionine-dependent homocysteine/selenocysteine methylase